MSVLALVSGAQDVIAALSPLIDRKLGYAASDFLRLRWHLSLGLGSLTIALGLLAGRVMAV